MKPQNTEGTNRLNTLLKIQNAGPRYFSSAGPVLYTAKANISRSAENTRYTIGMKRRTGRRDTIVA